MYYLTYDGDDKEAVSENLAVATIAFFEAVENGDWCPGLVDGEGVILAEWDNSSYDRPEGFSRLIGPEEDPNPEPGIDRAWEEHYRAHSPSITGIRESY